MDRMKTVTLNVSQISHPNDLQLRESLDTDHINELASVLTADGKLEPVKVVQEGQTYWLWDGHHTLAAHKQADVSAIECVITKQGTRQDARWEACSANSTHGLKRTKETKKRQIEAAIKLRPKESDRAIARHCGVSNTYVGEIRKLSVNQLTDTRTVTRGGKTYEQNTSKISKAQKDRHAKARAEKERADSAAQEAPTESAKSDPDPTPASPLEQINADIDRIIASLKSVASDMRGSFGFQKKKGTDEYQTNGRHKYSYMATVGAVNQIVSDLNDERPIDIKDGKVTTKRGKHLQEAMEGKRR